MGAALDLISLSSELPAAPPELEASEHSEQTPAAEVVGESEQDPPPSDLLLWLRAHRLDVYHEAILENQYESLDDLCNAESGTHEKLITLLEMKPGHAMRFRRALQQGGKDIETHLPTSPVIVSEQPPELAASEQPPELA